MSADRTPGTSVAGRWLIITLGAECLLAVVTGWPLFQTMWELLGTPDWLLAGYWFSSWSILVGAWGAVSSYGRALRARPRRALIWLAVLNAPFLIILQLVLGIVGSAFSGTGGVGPV